MNPSTKQTGVYQQMGNAHRGSKAHGNGSETASKMTMLWMSELIHVKMMRISLMPQNYFPWWLCLSGIKRVIFHKLYIRNLFEK